MTKNNSRITKLRQKNTITEELPEELQELAKEARKYKSAEEFGEAIFAKSHKKIEATKTKNGKYTIKVISKEEIRPDITGTYEQKVINEEKAYRRKNIPANKLEENIKEVKNWVIRDSLPIDDIILLRIKQYPEYQELLDNYGLISYQEYADRHHKLYEQARMELSRFNRLNYFYNQVIKGYNNNNNKNMKITKDEFRELTGEDPEDVLGNDWENEVEEFDSES